MKRVTDYEQIREYFLDAIVCDCCRSFRGSSGCDLYECIYQDAMGLVMIVAVGLMVLGIILAVSLNDVKKQKSGENE